MRILKSRKGMSFAAVLGLSMFIIATVTTVFVISFQQSRLVDVTIENTAEYENAKNAVIATLSIIARDQDLDPTYLSGLAAYMGVTVSDLGNGAFSVTGTVDADASVTSYIVYEDALETSYETFLQFTGSEPDFSLDPTVRVEPILVAYMTQFVDAEYGLTAPTLTTFQSVMTYYENTVRIAEGYASITAATLQNMANPTINVDTYVTGGVSLANNKDLTINSANCYINGNLTLGTSGDITITDGSVLIVDGTLTIKNNAKITGGTVIVKGNLTISSSNNNTYEYIHSTIYVRDTFTSDRHVVFGDATYGPTFLFCGLNCNLDSNKSNTATGILYAVCNNFYGNNAAVVLSGGVYAASTKQLSASGIAANATLDGSADLFAMGVPDTLGVSTGGFPGFRFTYPAID
ncbi:MAG TPA: hypothetical protein DCR44_00790 [Acholeplasmatales bacterium]|nr:MAG: hypothetical protein A2Y16_06945 [Tenericutes bacterium GWF2_57_13]HAQ55936.1 hypothetical protein [Acholeplasmatales bacterium]